MLQKRSFLFFLVFLFHNVAYGLNPSGVYQGDLTRVSINDPADYLADYNSESEIFNYDVRLEDGEFSLSETFLDRIALRGFYVDATNELLFDFVEDEDPEFEGCTERHQVRFFDIEKRRASVEHSFSMTCGDYQASITYSGELIRAKLKDNVVEYGEGSSISRCYNLRKPVSNFWSYLYDGGGSFALLSIRLLDCKNGKTKEVFRFYKKTKREVNRWFSWKTKERGRFKFVVNATGDWRIERKFLR